MKALLRILVPLAAIAAASPAFADSSDPEGGESYKLPTIVHGKTSMRKAMRPNSTFSFKLFLTEEPEPRKPYSYPEPSVNHR